MQLETVDLHDAIRQALNTCGEEITANRLDVVLRLNAPHHHARLDSARAQQIIWNLASEPDGSVCIEVRDTGIGIAPEALPRIFDAFEQGGSEVTRQFGGLGLGLAISKALVNLHGGTISATSEGKGSGARFVVHLPTTVKPADMQAGVVPPTTRAIACSILLVDDHADTRQTMARILRSLGCQVQTAGTVAEALTLAARQAFDLLISDIGLPDASGNELMRQVRRTYGFTGVALSGYGMDEDIARSRDAGFAAHLTKPVNLRLLEETVRRLAPAR